MTEISNPHDRFFKEVLSRQEVARDFLLHYVPANIVGLLDIDSLEIRKDSFVDKDLNEHFSDILYCVNMKQGGSSYVYALFEHKSYPEPLISLHLLRYMIRIWEQALKQGVARPLPPIIPIVMYHGKTRWKIGLEFFDLFDDLPEELKSFAPGFQYLLCDLSRYSDEEIKGSVVLRVALLILKYIFREDLREHLPGIFRLLRNLSEKRTGIEYIETILKYIINAAPTENIDREDLKAAVDEALPHRGGEIMPTIADSLREEGIRQGMQQGMQQGIVQSAREAVIDILEARFEVVPQSIVKRLNEIYDSSILKIFRRKAVKVMSLEEFEQIIDLMMK